MCSGVRGVLYGVKRTWEWVFCKGNNKENGAHRALGGGTSHIRAGKEQKHRVFILLKIQKSKPA